MNYRYNIGIDLDGPLRDFERQFINMARLFFGLQDVDLTNKDLRDFKDKSNKSIIGEVFTNPNISEYMFRRAQPTENSKKGYQRFVSDKRFRVYIVSNQPKHLQSYSTQWLKDNEFNQHEQTIYLRNKLKAPVNGMIDNNINTITKFITNKKDGLLFRNSRNLNDILKYESMYQLDWVDDLSEAYEYFNKKLT